MELLVVIAVIGVLATTVVINLSRARTRARIGQAKAEISQLKTAMLAYKEDNGELPPPGDNCSGCANPPNVTWTLVIGALFNGGYISRRLDKDPWGNYYGYDDNDCNSNPWISYLWTCGENKVCLGINAFGDQDDYGIVITTSCTGS